MPKLSDTMTEGTLVAWKKKKGDQVSAGEVLAEIETDKATMEWESPEDGTLTEIYVEDGGKVNVGDRIAFIGGEGEEATKQQAPAREKEKEPATADEKEKKPQAEKEKPAPAKAPEKETAPPRQQGVAATVSAARDEAQQQKTQPKEQNAEQPRVKASPVARRIAAELGVDLSSVKGTGPEGRVTETDVRAAAKSVAAVSVRPGVVSVAFTQTRRKRAYSTFRDAQNHRATAGGEPRPGSTLLSHDRAQCEPANGSA